MKGPKIQFEHPTQIAASTFLRAVSDNDAAAMWEKLSRETRGLLEGLYAARSAVALQHAAGVEPTGLDARLAEVVAPLLVSVIAALGGAEQMGGFGVSGARVIIRKACSRELTDLGLTFNSLNIKVVQSEVAESRRRQSAAEAQANADIVTAQQARRAKDAQLEAERVISDKQRELEQTKAANAALIAEAEAKKQTALGTQRVAELEATQIAQARADAEKMRIEAEARARAEAIRITTVAQANAESIQKVNEAIKAGGESYFRYRQIEMIPDIAPVIADALAKARLVTISGDSGVGGAAQSATSNITSVIQTVLAAQLVSNSGLMQQPESRDNARENGSEAAPVKAPASSPQPAPPAKTGFR